MFFIKHRSLKNTKVYLVILLVSSRDPLKGFLWPLTGESKGHGLNHLVEDVFTIEKWWFSIDNIDMLVFRGCKV